MYGEKLLALASSSSRSGDRKIMQLIKITNTFNDDEEKEPHLTVHTKISQSNVYKTYSDWLNFNDEARIPEKQLV